MASSGAGGSSKNFSSHTFSASLSPCVSSTLATSSADAHTRGDSSGWHTKRCRGRRSRGGAAGGAPSGSPRGPACKASVTERARAPGLVCKLRPPGRLPAHRSIAVQAPPHRRRAQQGPTRRSRRSAWFAGHPLEESPVQLNASAGTPFWPVERVTGGRPAERPAPTGTRRCNATCSCDQGQAEARAIDHLKPSSEAGVRRAELRHPARAGQGLLGAQTRHGGFPRPVPYRPAELRA